MSLIEIARLSAAQQAQLGPYGQRWASLRASTAAGDRKAAEAGVVTAYAVINGMSVPPHNGTGITVMDKDNVDDPEVAKFIYSE